MKEYATLWVGPVAHAIVMYPDGTESHHHAADVSVAVSRWQAGQRHGDVGSDAEVAAREAAHATWKRDLDSHLVGKVTSIAEYDRKRAEYVAQHPEPPFAGVGSAAAGPTVLERRGWGGRLMTANGAADLDSLEAGALVPLEEAIPCVLARVTGDRWEVVHVSYARETTQAGTTSRTAIVAVTFLLERAA